ncbi:hypothetical protein BV392_17655 [Rhodovulum sulfidophilum]|nr:hypothetical protein BV392_17655 [Rhodovulum sulfidophilum]
MPPQRVTRVTPGVNDLGRTRGFYEALGRRPAEIGERPVLFPPKGWPRGFSGEPRWPPIRGSPRRRLAPGRWLRHRTLAQGFPDRIGIDAARAVTLRTGAEPIKPPQEVFRGGYSGDSTDSDGRVRELPHTPYRPLDAEDRLTATCPARIMTAATSIWRLMRARF